MMHALKKRIPHTHPLRLAWHGLKTLIAALRYGFPARHLTIIGITGTDGKTTTTAMTAHILRSCGLRTAALSTAFFQIGDAEEWNATQKTSPSPMIIQRFLRDARSKGCTHVVLECSSHGLQQKRMLCTWPVVGAITNIAEEHLDYHGTMDAYMNAKGILLRSVASRGGTIILNAADRSFAHYATIACASRILLHTRTATRQGDQCLWLENETDGTTNVAALVCGSGNKSTALSLKIPGAFNLRNALTAIACAKAVGISREKATASLRTFGGVPGRMECLEEGQAFRAIIDFTVTPQAYETTLKTIRASSGKGKLLVLTGSCGDRMREKRPIIGQLCATYADIVVVANEDPYTEDPERIINEVMAGIPRTMPQYHGVNDLPPAASLPARFTLRIPDRLAAIRWLLQHAKNGDTILFAGKGADVTMWVRSGQIPWNERAIVRDKLRALRTRAS